jgi:hypothetical protein
MKANFDQQHRASMGEDLPLSNLGYPDTGSGIYSAKLSY